MTVAEFLNIAQTQLKSAGIESARLDSIILTEDELTKDRAWLLANPEQDITKSQLKTLMAKLARRVAHEPLAYIRGFSDFYGRRFNVNKNVLEPRPETETMIEMLLKLPIKSLIADIGTGSGALAITAKLELPEAKVIGVDIDPKCLYVARKNSNQLRADVKFYEGNLLSGLPAKFEPEIILANLPYVPKNFYMNQAAKREPSIATYGGQDGMDIYRRFFEQLKSYSKKPKFILTESLLPQHQKLATIASGSGYNLGRSQNLIQQFEHL